MTSPQVWRQTRHLWDEEPQPQNWRWCQCSEGKRTELWREELLQKLSDMDRLARSTKLSVWWKLLYAHSKWWLQCCPSKAEWYLVCQSKQTEGVYCVRSSFSQYTHKTPSSICTPIKTGAIRWPGLSPEEPKSLASSFGHFLRGRSLKDRCNICGYVPVCACVFLGVSLPPPPTSPVRNLRPELPPPHPQNLGPTPWTNYPLRSARLLPCSFPLISARNERSLRDAPCCHNIAGTPPFHCTGQQLRNNAQSSWSFPCTWHNLRHRWFTGKDVWHPQVVKASSPPSPSTLQRPPNPPTFAHPGFSRSSKKGGCPQREGRFGCVYSFMAGPYPGGRVRIWVCLIHVI